MKTVMTPMHLEAFLKKHGISNARLSRILGVTPPAVDHWITGRRGVPHTVVKVLTLIDQNPQIAQALEAIT